MFCLRSDIVDIGDEIITSFPTLGNICHPCTSVLCIYPAYDAASQRGNGGGPKGWGSPLGIGHVEGKANGGIFCLEIMERN